MQVKEGISRGRTVIQGLCILAVIILNITDYWLMSFAPRLCIILQTPHTPQRRRSHKLF